MPLPLPAPLYRAPEQLLAGRAPLEKKKRSWLVSWDVGLMMEPRRLGAARLSNKRKRAPEKGYQ